MAKALEAAGAEATVLVRSSEVPAALGVVHEVCARTQSPDSLRQRVLAYCDQMSADTLVVDTFPEGLLGELGGSWAGPRRVALLRCRKDASAPGFRSATDAVDAAVDLEPHLEWLDAQVPSLGPITRVAEGPPQHRGHTLDVLIVASEPALIDFARRLEPRLRALGLSVRLEDGTSFPLDLETLRPRVLVGPAGFNLTYEARALGIWHIALPRPRSHDDQLRRAEAVARVVRSPHALERLAAQLCKGASAPARAPLHHPRDVARFILDA